MGRVFALVALTAACSSAPHRPDVIPIGDYSYTLEYLEWRIGKMLEDEELPGLSIALVDDQDVVWLQGFGSTRVSGGEAVTADTVWRVGSVTKLLTAIEVLRLQEDGLADLDAPITTWMPDFSVRTRESDPAPITLRSMLAHRSGLPRNSGLPGWYWDPGVDVLQAQAEAMSLWYVAHPVGYRYHYSNAAFNVMGALVERRRSALWVPYLQDELMGPLGMDDSALLLQELPHSPSVAVGHWWDEDSGTHRVADQGDLIELASGNLYATVPDVVDLVQFFFRDGEAGGEHLLSADTVWSMYDVQYRRPRDPQPMGLAWFTSQTRFPEPVVHHGGTVQGTETLVALLPASKLGVVVVSNSTRFGDLKGVLAVEALDLMLETRTGAKPLPYEKEDTVDVDPDQLDLYVGRYVCDSDLLSVFRGGGRLKVDLGGTTLRLLPLGGDRFQLAHWLQGRAEMEVTFFVSDPDQPDILVVDIGRMDHLICPRYPDVDPVPALWQQIIGTYSVHPRVESAYFEGDDLGSVKATIEDRALHLGGLWVWPLSEEALRVVGGEWDGETVLRDPATGELTFQSEVDVPTGG